MHTKLAIVGIFYDGYYDIWEDFLELIEKNWKNNPYPIYIVNNEKDITFEKKYNINVLHAGVEAEYSKKVQKAIECIDADYYLLLLEDFFVSKKVNNRKIAAIMEKMEREKLKYYRMTIPDFLTKKDLKNPIGFIDESFEYTVSCQPSIWKKDFLKKCIGAENYNAWIFEGIYSKSKQAHTKDFLKGCMYDYTNPLELRHGYVQGKMLPSVYEYFSKEGYYFKAKRGRMTKKQYRLYIGKTIIKSYFPRKIQNKIKKLLNGQSVLEKYDVEIYHYMKLMDIK